MVIIIPHNSGVTQSFYYKYGCILYINEGVFYFIFFVRSQLNRRKLSPNCEASFGGAGLFRFLGILEGRGQSPPTGGTHSQSLLFDKRHVVWVFFSWKNGAKADER